MYKIESKLIALNKVSQTKIPGDLGGGGGREWIMFNHHHHLQNKHDKVNII